MRLKIYWRKDCYGKYAWICRYGNITTESTLHPQRCYILHMKKLYNKGIDISKIESNFDIIDPERRGNYAEYRNSTYNSAN